MNCKDGFVLTIIPPIFLPLIILLTYKIGSLINQVFLKFMLHFINLGLILAGGVIVRQLTRDPGILSINLIT